MLENLPPWVPLVVIAATLALTVGVGQGFYWAYVSRRQAEQDRLSRRLGTVVSQEDQSSLFREIQADSAAKALGSLGEHLHNVLTEAESEWSVARFLLISSVIAGALGVVFYLVVGPPGLLGGLAIGSLPYVFLKQKATVRNRKLIQQLPEALDLMSRSLQAGLDLSDAFKMCAEELPLPIAGEFGRVFEEIRFGRDYRTALGALLSRNPRLFELRMFVSSVLLQRETGGNLIEVLNAISNTIRARFLFDAKVRAMTSEARFSALVLGGLPLSVLGLLSVMNPVYLEPLFTETLGNYILGFMLMMYIVGGSLMYRITQVEV